MNKTVSYVLMAGSIMSIVAGTWMIYHYFFTESPATAIALGIAGTLVMHLPQLPRSLKVARPKNISLPVIVAKTILFGATWWKSLEKGVVNR